jgi:cell division protein FtsB
MSSEDKRKNKKTTGLNRRLRLFVMFPLCLLIVWSSIKIVDNMIIAAEKRDVLTDLEQKLKKEQEMKRYYEQEIHRLQDQEYREQQARKQFNMIKPGETMYSLPETQ